MAVGSLPYLAVEPALDLVAKTTPEVPAWPQLPRRSFLENMYVQFSEGLPGLIVDTETERLVQRHAVCDEELVTFAEALERANAGDSEYFRISPERAAGLYALPGLLSRLSPRPAFIKGQITGPVSFCLQVTDEDRRPILYDDTLRELATELLSARARWEQQFLESLAPEANVIMMIDEPFLTQWGSGYLSMPDELVLSSLERVAGSLDCLVGIHICGGTDWSKIVNLPLDILNFDAADYLNALLVHAEAVGAFVQEGGLLAFGAVPNDERALVLSAEAVADTVEEGVRGLVGGGLVGDKVLLEHSLVTPACGTGALPVATAEACLWLAAGASEVLRRRWGL